MSERTITVTCPHCDELHEVRVDVAPNPPTDERHYSAKEVARMMGVSPYTVKRWIYDKKLRGIRMPGRTNPWRIPASALAEFKQQHRTYQPH